MRKVLIVLTALLGAAGCNMPTEEEQLENAIRDGLANQGTVQEINLVAEGENGFAGYAMIRENSGRSGRLNCTAQRADGSNFNWRCSPAIDEAVLQEIENSIRQNMSQQAEVAEVDMQRAGDDDHMTGYVLLRDGMGGEARVPCAAERTEGANFNWRCGEEVAAAGAPAAAPGGGK